MIFLFDGEEEFSKAEAVQELRSRFADATLASLNTNMLDASRLTPAALEEAALSMPFMADRRLVVVSGLLGSLAQRRNASRKRTAESGGPDPAQELWLDRLHTLVRQLPSTTDLVFVEPAAISAGHPLLKPLQAVGCQRRTFPALNLRRREDREAVSDWVKARVASKGGRIDPMAVVQLIERCGPNLRLLDQELEKLVVYSGSAVITEPVVTLLVGETREADIWEMVRAIGAQDARLAMRTLHRLLEAGERPEAIFFQLVRQLRLLIEVAELAGHADNATIAERLGLQEWQVRQHREQLAAIGAEKARRFYRELLETDVAIKTGRTSPELALDLLVGDLCGMQ